VFEIRVLRRIFGPKKGEVHNLYSSPSILRMIELRRMRWAGHVARKRNKRNAHRKTEGNKIIRILSWEDNIKIDLRYDVVITGLIWLRLRTSESLL
jgi:hypothetical protein